MSQLQKEITRIQRREGPRMGFGAAVRETPNAMLLALRATNGASVDQAFARGASVVVLSAPDAEAAAKALGSPNGKKRCVGALLGALDEAGAKALAAAGCDFVISPLATTASEAVDSDRMGQVVNVALEIDDATLRAFGPLQLDALFVERKAGAMTLGEQLGLVRLAAFASTPLLATVGRSASGGELRVLRDSGVAAILPPAETTAAEVEALLAALKAVPAPRKGKRDTHEIALVPAVASAHDHDEADDDDDDGE